jgi:hypothetical protein
MPSESIVGTGRASLDLGKARKAANDDFDHVIQEIRKLPGFGDFLQPPNEDDIRAAAPQGPVVFVNVSKYRCDALCIRSDSIDHVPLPQLYLQDIEDRLDNFGKLGTFKQDTLEWLWDTVAYPILEKLNIMTPTCKELSRIWWIPIGLLSRFPLHAAGYHISDRPRAVLDFVISSYSTSLKALRQSRFERTVPEAKGVALIAMKNTPGNFRQLYFADAEAQAIAQICQKCSIAVVEPSRTKVSVLDALQSCDILHFAGHGQASRVDPLQSKLFLNDWKTAPLTVHELIEANIGEHRPLLAYLSACETGQVNDQRGIDEGLHLVSSFQVAGFRNVIGSLWQVDDESCKRVAEQVYEVVLANMTDESICIGLHTAVKQFRDQWRASGKSESRAERDYGFMDTDQPISLDWVPFVHFGA